VFLQVALYKATIQSSGLAKHMLYSNPVNNCMLVLIRQRLFSRGDRYTPYVN